MYVVIQWLLLPLQPLDPKSLFKLTFHKNAEGLLNWVVGCVYGGYSADKYHCPVTYKVFNENTHIVTVRTTGNVYCMEVSYLVQREREGDLVLYRQWRG